MITNLKSKVSFQKGAFAYNVVPATLEFKDGILSFTKDDSEEIFKTSIDQVSKTKDYGDFLYIWIGHKCYNINFASPDFIKKGVKTTVVGNLLMGAAGAAATIPQYAEQEERSYSTVEQWINLFNNHGIKSRHHNLYRSKWIWVAIAIVILLTLYNTKRQ